MVVIANGVPSTTVNTLVVTVIVALPRLVALLVVSATLMAGVPAAVPAAAIIVKPAETVAPSATSTAVGLKVIPVAVGVRVIAPPTAAVSRVSVAELLTAPPSTTDAAAVNITVDGPERDRFGP